jgi:enamine deaminase RidA (YjgF/YER057c/UK114 family)
LALLALVAHLSEALAAEHGTVGLGLEGNLSLAAATGAGSGEELTGATGGVLASITAVLAALGLVLEATLSVESLFASGEHELIAALFANQILIFVHCFYLSSVSCPVKATGNLVGTRSL